MLDTFRDNQENYHDAYNDTFFNYTNSLKIKKRSSSGDGILIRTESMNSNPMVTQYIGMLINNSMSDINSINQR